MFLNMSARMTTGKVDAATQTACCAFGDVPLAAGTMDAIAAAGLMAYVASGQRRSDRVRVAVLRYGYGGVWAWGDRV